MKGAESFCPLKMVVFLYLQRNVCFRSANVFFPNIFRVIKNRPNRKKINSRKPNDLDSPQYWFMDL